MTYQAWTYRDVRDRVIEAAETLMMSPAALGPRMLGSMSDVFNEYIDDYRRGETTRIRRTPAPGALSRMEETWKWINAFLGEKDRKTLYDYGFLKTRKGMYLARYLERNSLVRRTFERRINRCCQIIANNLNRMYSVRLTEKLDGLSQITQEADLETVSSVNYANHWMAPDAKPRHLPERLESPQRTPVKARAG